MEHIAAVDRSIGTRWFVADSALLDTTASGDPFATAR
jgi:hypothetical protein